MEKAKRIFGLGDIYEWKDKVIQYVTKIPKTPDDIEVLGQKALNNITINIPDSIEEQQRIVSRLDSLSAHVRELEEVTQKTIAECDALKQALLRKVFE